MDNDFNLNSTLIITRLWEKRKVLLIVAAVAFVASTVVTLLIPNKYEATAIIMPPAANQTSKELFTASQQEGLTVFGENEEAEQFQQVITSRTLKDLVINRLNLWGMWGIDPQAPQARSKMYIAYDECVRVKSTKFQGVAISARDRSPELAAIIANTVVGYSDSLMRDVKRQVAQKALIAYQKQYNLELEAMVALQDSMRKVMVAGVTSPEMQSKEFTRAYVQALASGNSGYANKLDKQLAPIKEHGSKYIRYNYELEYAAENIVMLGNYLKVLRVEAAQEIPSQFVIDRAIAPDKKIAPKRSILVVLSTLSALLFAVFAIVIIELFNSKLRSIK